MDEKFKSGLEEPKIDLDSGSDFEELREKTLIEMFGALEGTYGPNFECRYYPCHFGGQDCSFCYCPFYPCLNYSLGGKMKVSNGGYVWDCTNCWWIHENDNVENIILSLSKYPRQKLIEEDWLFYSRILQELYYGEEKGELTPSGDGYNLIPATFYNRECDEVDVDDVEFIKVELIDFGIKTIEKVTSVKDEGIHIPLKEGRRFYGVLNGKPVVCKL